MIDVYGITVWEEHLTNPVPTESRDRISRMQLVRSLRRASEMGTGEEGTEPSADGIPAASMAKCRGHGS